MKSVIVMNKMFEFEYNGMEEMLIVNYQEGFSYNMCYEDDVFSVAVKLNEQQATITKLEQICEKKMQEIEDIKYSLKEIAYKYRKEVQFKADTDPNQAVKEVLSEQQATINRQAKVLDLLMPKKCFYDGYWCKFLGWYRNYNHETCTNDTITLWCELLNNKKTYDRDTGDVIFESGFDDCPLKRELGIDE